MTADVFAFSNHVMAALLWGLVFVSCVCLAVTFTTVFRVRMALNLYNDVLALVRDTIIPMVDQFNQVVGALDTNLDTHIEKIDSQFESISDAKTEFLELLHALDSKMALTTGLDCPQPGEDPETFTFPKEKTDKLIRYLEHRLRKIERSAKKRSGTTGQNHPRLGEILIEKGILDEDKLADALARQAREDEWLSDTLVASVEDLLRGKATGKGSEIEPDKGK